MKRRAAFPAVRSAVLSDGSLLCRSAGKMIIPSGGAHVRQVEFRLPRLAANPVVNATVFPTNSAGPSFAIYSIAVNQMGSQTQVAVSAQYGAGSSGAAMPKPKDLAAYDVRCHIIVSGMPEAAPARRKSRKRTK